MRIPAPDSTRLSPLQQDVLAWHIRRRRADWQEADELAFRAWLAARPAHRAAYARWEAHERTLAALPPAAVARLRSRLAIDKARRIPQAEARPATRRRPAPVWAGLAALAIGVGAAAWHHQYAQPVFAQSYATARGELMDVPLPDGTRLQLDTATKVHVVYYRKRRDVVLKEGQAMFSVAADGDRPFRVEAGNTQVSVVGTRFSVRHTPAQPGMEAVQVAVEEGRVRVARKAEGIDRWLPDALNGVPAAELSAGQQLAALASGAPGPIHAVAPRAIAPWREHRLSFVNRPLGEALAELNRYADTGLAIHDARVAALRISGSFDPRRVDALKRILPRALPVRLVAAGEHTEIVASRSGP